MTDWNEFEENRYIPVAERQRMVREKIEALRQEGSKIEPIAPFKHRGIAKSFWGKAWCRHLESLSDYANRLPSGRSTVRNGSVCHLAIDSEQADAKVCDAELYDLSIHIAPLCPEKWDQIRKQCNGKVGSLIELLKGEISDEIMEIVTHRETGLFPLEDEIRFNCNCPDWAEMCTHVAAALYGIGVRLDTEPALLFKLRGVDQEELIAVDHTIDELTQENQSHRRRTLNSDEMDDIFGIDLDPS